jgi:hypothetical protein
MCESSQVGNREVLDQIGIQEVWEGQGRPGTKLTNNFIRVCGPESGEVSTQY